MNNPTIIQKLRSKEEIKKSIKRLQKSSNDLKNFNKKSKSYKICHDQHHGNLKTILETEVLNLKTLCLLANIGEVTFDQPTQMIAINSKEGFGLLEFNEII